MELSQCGETFHIIVAFRGQTQFHSSQAGNRRCQMLQRFGMERIVSLLAFRQQRQKNLGSRVALQPGKFLHVQKDFARITEKTFETVPILSKRSGFFQMISNFTDGFKTVRIFPDDCQFSGLFQNCPDFSR